MPPPPEPPLQVIAMHGWAGDASSWRPWKEASASLPWRWRCGERGYGGRPPMQPCWEPGEGGRVVIAHSLGAHLLPADLLAAAEAVVLLASFGQFVAPGRDARRLAPALAGMSQRLRERSAEGPSVEPETSARDLLRVFLAEAAAPDPPELLPPGPADGPLGPEQRRRLREDLALLAATSGLPRGFPNGVPVLLVEAGDDRIVSPAARAQLREALPDATVLQMAGAGHSLLRAAVIPPVLAWLREQRIR